MVKLEILSLFNNKITTIDSGLFQKLPLISWILLEHNEIEGFSDGTFVGLNKLEELELNDNRLTSLKMSSFGELPTLSGMNINNNNLSRMSSLF